MQVIKRIWIIFVAFCLFGCNSRLVDNRIEISDKKYDIIDYDVINQDAESYKENVLRVGVLLPLTGKASSVGLGMQNAMFMAIDDLKNNNMVLKFYDTKSTKQGANEAIEQAIYNGAEIILGPLMNDEVEGISKIALSRNIPVVSFTTSSQNLQKGVYSIGLLMNEQIDRSISYMSSQGRKSLVLLVPNDNTGLNIVKSALTASLNHNISIEKVGFYNPKSVDFSQIVKTISSPVNFDTVLIADSGNRLKSLISMFAYNDVLYPNVLFLGTTAWDNTNLSRETMLYHGVYPMLSKSYETYFVNKYQENFGEKPNSLASFAYDSVLLASGLSSKDRNSFSEIISSRNGFIGVNGFFRILPTGQSLHSLDMYEVTQNGPVMVNKQDNGSIKNFVDNGIDVRYIPYEKLPKFYGKNSSEVLQWLYNN